MGAPVSMSISNIFWLGTKELRSLQRDKVMLVFLIYSFTFAIYSQATGTSSDVNNASVGIVDEDHSTLSGRIAGAFFAPSFQEPELIGPDEIDESMDGNRFMFVLNIPPDLERYVLDGRPAEIQLNIDATAMGQAGIGSNYIQSIVQDEVMRFLQRRDGERDTAVRLVVRRAFNPNGNPVWFNCLVALVNQVTMLTIILTGAALIREKEHGTFEHLLVMPLTSMEIALAKVWSNSLVILSAVAVAVFLIVQQVLAVPIAGSVPLFMLGVAVYLFFATALGIFLGAITRSMAQFAMLVILVIIALQMLSGGTTPIESQPVWLQYITYFLPSRHFFAFAQAIVYRGAGFALVWPSFLTVVILASLLFGLSLLQFRRSVANT